MAKSEAITKYEVLFAARTGVTIMLQKSNLFNDTDPGALAFEVGENPCDLVISTRANHQALIKDLRREIVDEALERGFIMFYELENDEVVRCTPCYLRP